MTENKTTSDVSLNEMLASALVQKKMLLDRFPRLKPLQTAIDKALTRDQSLGDRFLSIGAVHARFRRPSGEKQLP